jgi:hypothetical protein
MHERRLEAVVAQVADACSTASMKTSAAVYCVCLSLTDAAHAACFQCMIKKDLYVSCQQLTFGTTLSLPKPL